MPIDPLLYFLFILATVGFIFTPGPIVSLIIAETMHANFKNGLAVALGAQFVSIIYLAINLFGFASIAALPNVFLDAIRYAGAAYLLYLAYAAYTRKVKPIDVNADCSATNLSPTKSFRKSLIIASTSPKTILFFAAFFPQFISDELAVTPQLAILSITFLLVSFTLDLGWVVMANKARQFLLQKDKLQLANQISGFALAAGAILLLALNN